MMKLAVSPVAACLLQSLLNRAGVRRSWIMLTDLRSANRRSLTFIGERHDFEFRIPSDEANMIAGRLEDQPSDHEFDIAGNNAADIQLICPLLENRAGDITLCIEVLTTAE